MNNQAFFTTILESTEKSLQLKDFGTPAVDFELLSSEYLYVGYKKPFCQFYMEFETPETAALTQTFEYYNGVGWTALDVVDETENYTKSGFIYFQRPDAWAETTVQTQTKYFIRVSSDTDLTTGTKLKGLNILLSNDVDLVSIRSNIVSKHNNGESWVEKHELARNWIMQTLRNAGNRTYEENVDKLSDKTNVIMYKDLTPFDLLAPFELREASKYYTAGLIYLNELSDDPEDKFERMGERFIGNAEELAELFMLKLDTNDDGVEQAAESDGLTRTNLTWV